MIKIKLWHVLAGGGALFALSRLKGGGGSVEKQPSVEVMMTAAHQNDNFNLLIKQLGKTGGLSTEQMNAQRVGPLRVVLELKVSSFEKMFAGDISGDARKAAKKLAGKLGAACPGAPTIANTNPAILKVKDVGAGFRVTLVWPAVWKGSTTGPVRSQVLACIKGLLGAANKDFAKRLIRLTAERVS